MDNNKEQFSQIYDQYVEKIYRFVYLKVNSRETAEDITSKVFLRGWEAYQNQISNIKNQKEIKNMNAFLYQIARNAVIDYYREKGRTKVISADFASQMADSGTNLYEKAALNEDIENIKSAMQNINKDYQDVLIWHYLDDMPVAEISDILSKPAGTVRVMIHRGLKALRGELRGEA